MVNLYKNLYQLFYYIKDNIETKYLILSSVLLFVFIFMNLSTILWWGLLVVLLYFLYMTRKENVLNADKRLEKLCQEHPELEICKLFNESKKNHKKIVETIQNRLAIK